MFEPNRPTRFAAGTATRQRRSLPRSSRSALRAPIALCAVLLSALVLASPALAATSHSSASPKPASAAASKPARAVIDYSSGFTASTPAALKNAGVGIVIRYVGSSAWKCLTPAEATALRSNGIDIATVYESTADWMLGGRSAGVAAANAARAAVIAAGGPSHPYVYFACDMDTSDFSAVNDALFGAQTVLGANNVGIYGSYSVCANALSAHAASKAWQTVAWSKGQVLPDAALLQLLPQTLGDLGVDYDSNLRYTSDVGQWGLGDRPSGLPSNPPGSVSLGAGAIASQTPTVEIVEFTAQSAPTTATLRAVESTDGVRAWAVGDRGTVLHTSSSGTTWTVQSTPTTAALDAVHFIDNATGWAAGENGTVFHTADGGLTWDGQSTPTTATLRAVAFADARSGWAVGDDGAVLHTTNGGVNWAAQSAPTTATLRAVSFSSDTTGVAVGDGGTYAFTNNGGASWFTASTPTTATISAYCATSPDVRWSVGASGTVLATGNDGATWEVRSTPTTSALTGVAFADASRGVSVGASGTVLFTQDAGQDWSLESAPTTAALCGVKLVGGKGWAVGEHGAIFRLKLVPER